MKVSVQVIKPGDVIDVGGERCTVREVTNDGCCKDTLKIRLRFHPPLHVRWNAEVERVVYEETDPRPE